MGIKTIEHTSICFSSLNSEKPPHHMGIKTVQVYKW